MAQHRSDDRNPRPARRPRPQSKSAGSTERQDALELGSRHSGPKRRRSRAQDRGRRLAGAGRRARRIVRGVARAPARSSSSPLR